MTQIQTEIKPNKWYMCEYCESCWRGINLTLNGEIPNHVIRKFGANIGEVRCPCPGSLQPPAR
jgi:hypothetical protein